MAKKEDSRRGCLPYFITTMRKQTANTVIFIVFILIAGGANLLSRTDIPAWDNLCSCINYCVYIGLLLFWIQSVFTRLLPSSARTYMAAAGITMLLYMMLRIFKYRMIIDASVIERYAVYAYWIPQMLVPALFLMVCICIHRGDAGRRKINEKLFLIPAAVLALLAMTNDLHRLIYVPSVELSSFRVESGTYTYGPCLYLLYAWMALAVAAGLVPLVRRMGRKSFKAILTLSGLVCLWAGLIFVYFTVVERTGRLRIFNIPEIHIFCMLGILEACIRHRLIPYNENHTGFFSKLTVPVLITDREFTPVYQTGIPVAADSAQLRAALEKPVYPDEDTRLSGMPVRAGFAFWTEDESELHRERRHLASANEVLSEENELIEAENRLKEEKAHLDAQNRVYDRIAEALYPKQKRIEGLLRDAKPDTEEFRKALGICCALNAWSKRKSNLLLLSEETLPVRNRELFLALQESARFLKCCGVAAAAVGEEYSDFPLRDIHELYDTFETILEAWLPDLRTMTVSLTADGIRLAMDVRNSPVLPETFLPAECKISEDITFLTIRRRTGGDAS